MKNLNFDSNLVENEVVNWNGIEIDLKLSWVEDKLKMSAIFKLNFNLLDFKITNSVHQVWGTTFQFILFS